MTEDLTTWTNCREILAQTDFWRNCSATFDAPVTR
jgi:hypothetical protein